MTCYLSIIISEKLKLDISKLSFKVSEKAVKTIGTSANLIIGDQVKSTFINKLSFLHLLNSIIFP